jgi:restriction endonuclease S subunit
MKYVTKSTISGINNENLNNINILVPPIELQKV